MHRPAPTSLALAGLALLVACGHAEAPADLAPAPDMTPVDPRQAERDASIFTNLDFEDVDGNGVPSGWTCECVTNEQWSASDCRTTATGAEHGERALVLPTGCSAYQRAKSYSKTMGVRFDYFSRGAVVYPNAAEVASANENVVDTAFVAGLADAEDAWRPVASLGSASTAGSDLVGLYFTNTTLVDMQIDDVVAVQDQPNPMLRAGSLLRGRHFESMSYAVGSDPASVYVSLPVDYASQVPLYVELTVSPPSVVDHVEYVSEDEGNWGAIVHFVTGASAADVDIAYDTVVFDRDLTDAERPTVYAANGDPSQWLAGSAIADSSYAPLAANARSLAPSSMAPLDQLLATIQFTSSYITNPTEITGLDATTVWNSRDASCTGYANLASATGRAIGVPTRHVTNMLVGMSQDMHSINEFYLGPSLGWRRVEPQAAEPTVAEDYGLIMRLVLPGDEVAAALPTRPWVLGGAPLHEFTEPVTGGDRLAPLAPSQPFADCASCINRADQQAFLRASAADVKTAFEAARASWQSDRAEYLAGGLSATKMTARRAFLNAHSFADVTMILNKLP